MVVVVVIAVGGGTAGAVMFGLQGSDEALCRELLAKSAKFDLGATAQLGDKNCDRYLSSEEIFSATLRGASNMLNNSPSADHQSTESEPKPVRSGLTGAIIKEEFIVKVHPTLSKYPDKEHGDKYWSLKEWMDKNEARQLVILKACDDRTQDHDVMFIRNDISRSYDVPLWSYNYSFKKDLEKQSKSILKSDLYDYEREELTERVADQMVAREKMWECFQEYKEFQIVQQALRR